MNNTLRLSLISVVGMVGCAETRAATLAEMSVEPICDGSDALRLGYNVSGGQVENTYEFTNPFGWQFFAIDGKCHYYASRHADEGIVAGVLSAADAKRLTSELHYGELPASSIDHGGSCSDASGVSLFTGSSTTTCLCSCDGVPDNGAEAIKHAGEWLEELADSGEPLDGAIRGLAKLQGRLGSPFPKYDWPLETPIDKVDGLLIQPRAGQPVGSGVRFEGSDSDALRALRATSIDDAKEAEAQGRHIETLLIKGPSEELEYKLFLRDELPEEDSAALRELFEIP